MLIYAFHNVELDKDNNQKISERVEFSLRPIPEYFFKATYVIDMAKGICTKNEYREVEKNSVSDQDVMTHFCTVYQQDIKAFLMSSH